MPPSPKLATSLLARKRRSSMDIPHHLIPYLNIAHDGLQQPLSQLLENSLPDWIIPDFAPHWFLPIASKLGISMAFFSIFNASSFCFFGPTKPSITKVQEPRSEPEHMGLLQWRSQKFMLGEVRLKDKNGNKKLI